MKVRTVRRLLVALALAGGVGVFTHIEPASAAGATAAPAVSSDSLADEPTAEAGILACRQYNDRSDLYSPDGDGYWYPGENHRVPTDSTCQDIQIWVHSGQPCAFFRVRFIGQYATGWRPACTENGFVILATNVVNGTLYRVESHPLNGPRSFTVMH